jgi:hypothetical protein
LIQVITMQAEARVLPLCPRFATAVFGRGMLCEEEEVGNEKGGRGGNSSQQRNCLQLPLPLPISAVRLFTDGTMEALLVEIL